MTRRAVSIPWLSAAAWAGMFFFGVVMAMLGTVLPVLSERLRFDLARAGGLFLAMNFAMLATTLVLGPLIDRFGKKPVLVAGSLAVSAALVLIAAAASYETLRAAVFLLGAGGGALNGGTNTLIADLHANPARKSSALNVLGIFFGFGALFQPFLLGTLVQRLDLAPILYVTIGLSFVPLAMFAALPFPPPRVGPGFRLAEAGKLVRNPLVLALGFLLFFQSGNEFIVGGYTSTYLNRDLNASIRTASYILAAYWGAMMLGRVISSRLVYRMKGSKLLTASALLAAGGVAWMLLAGSAGTAAVGVILVGLGFASIYPVTLGFAGSRFEHISGTAFGILFAIALTGGMTMPWLVGQLAAARGLRFAFWLAAANCLAITLLQFVVSRLGRRTGRAE
ncbi:MAG TPA: MFS transporter [Bryobacteraceae bacterium]|nr:MFS transporter [Bryobacteraceae bacterium]